jgi:hypothetical protein
MNKYLRSGKREKVMPYKEIVNNKKQKKYLGYRLSYFIAKVKENMKLHCFQTLYETVRRKILRRARKTIF